MHGLEVNQADADRKRSHVFVIGPGSMCVGERERERDAIFAHARFVIVIRDRDCDDEEAG